VLMLRYLGCLESCSLRVLTCDGFDDLLLKCLMNLSESLFFNVNFLHKQQTPKLTCKRELYIISMPSGGLVANHNRNQCITSTLG
jgi:hypothetical protein